MNFHFFCEIHLKFSFSNLKHKFHTISLKILHFFILFDFIAEPDYKQKDVNHETDTGEKTDSFQEVPNILQNDLHPEEDTNGLLLVNWSKLLTFIFIIYFEKFLLFQNQRLMRMLFQLQIRKPS